MTNDEDASPPRPPSLVLVLDAIDPARLAEFWGAALRYSRQDAIGPFEVLVPPDGHDSPAMLIQAVEDPKLGKNRMHLDLHVPDPEAEATRMIDLGARRISEGSLDEIRWILMADPEGNEFDIGWD